MKTLREKRNQNLSQKAESDLRFADCKDAL